MKIIFMGTPDFSVPILQQIIDEGHEILAVVTQPDRPKGRKKTLTPPPVKREAEKHQLRVFQPEQLQHLESYEPIIKLQPDVIVTAAYGQILPKAVLEAPPLGCVNVHASLLPLYRGGAPIHQAIIDGQEETGVTIMYMAEKLDAGDILSQTAIKIEETDTVGSLHDKLSEVGADLLVNTLKGLEQGTIDPIPQDHAKATFASNIKRGQEKINWEKNGEDIYNHIRGMNPWPVAYTYWRKKPLKIWWAEKVPASGEEKPGKIMTVTDEDLVVATGNKTAIKVVRLQPAGKKPMHISDFLRGAGNELVEGDTFGDG